MGVDLWIRGTILFDVGWIGMVSGFALVIYSRLSILVQSRLILRLTLVMIIVNGVLLHTGTIILTLGSTVQLVGGSSKNHAQWLKGAKIMERLQLVGFTVQETIISCLYTKAAWNHLQAPFFPNQSTKMVMRLLITVQLLVFIIDIMVAEIDCAGYFAIKGIIYAFAYSVKLELEFIILNQLVAISHQGLPPRLLSTPLDSISRLPNASTTAPPLQPPPPAISGTEKRGEVKSSN
jgi:hypothetical protein